MSPSEVMQGRQGPAWPIPAGWARSVCAGLTVAWLAGGCGRPVEPYPPPAAAAPGAAEIAACPWVVPLAATVTGLGEGPVALAVSPDGGRLYVGNRAGVRVLDASGQTLAEWPTGGPVRCLAVADNGWLTVGLAQSLEVYDGTGQRQAAWGQPGHADGGLLHVTCVAVAAQEVWVADAGHRLVRRFAANGDFVGDLGQRDPALGVPGLVVPSPHLDCAVSATGELWVANPGRHKLERYGADGRVLASWGSPGLNPAGFSGCCNPTDIALLEVPEPALVTSEKGLPRVKIYSRSGQLRAYIGPEHFRSDTAGIDLATDSAGRLYALDPMAAKVLVFGPARPATPAAAAGASAPDHPSSADRRAP